MPLYQRKLGYASRKSYSGAAASRKSAALNRTAVRFPRRNTANYPVARALRKPRRAPTKVNRNRSGIMTLARQVSMLQNQKFGIIQQQTQYVQWTGTVLPAALPSPTLPVCFLMNDFYEQTCYRGRMNGTIATFDDGPVMQKQTYDPASLNTEFNWLARQNTDIVSPNHYLPVYTRINMDFDFEYTGVGPPGVVRIDILKVRAYNTTNQISVNLPTALGAYRNLAIEPSNLLRNYYSPQFHQVLKTYWVKVTNPCRTAAESASFKVKRTFSWKFQHRDFVSPGFTDPPGPTDQSFFTNVPRNQQLWMLISVDRNAQQGLQNINMGRVNRWRDHHAAI